MDVGPLHRKPGRGKKRVIPERPIVPPWEEPSAKVLQEKWDSEYALCTTHQKTWDQIHDPEQDWPKGYKLLHGKMYHEERLCVPTLRAKDIVKGQHEWNAHPGDERFLGFLENHYKFPAQINLRKLVKEHRKNCLTCQACKATNENLKAPIHMTVIPPRTMMSVSMDVFHLPEVTWQNQQYDAFLLCVDRHSGWMIAKPTREEGLTGEKAAHLLIDTSWGEMGLPSIVTSDKGSQFVYQWFATTCARLGIRQAFSQAYHHQANGRAEVGGRILKDTLRALLVGKGINWVEALPRALRIIHDTPDPTTGLTPYEILFGRPRSLATLPWDPHKTTLTRMNS